MPEVTTRLMMKVQLTPYNDDMKCLEMTKGWQKLHIQQLLQGLLKSEHGQSYNACQFSKHGWIVSTWLTDMATCLGYPHCIVSLLAVKSFLLEF